MAEDAKIKDANLETSAPEATDTSADEPQYAKSGKKSKKHLEEVKAEEERQARKAETKAAEAAGEKPKGAAPIVRPRLERRSKKYQEAHKLITKDKIYPLEEAVELATKTSTTKFPGTIEAHVRLGVDPRQADQNIRTTVVLPHGNGKTIKVAVFAPLDECKKALAAGADRSEECRVGKECRSRWSPYH